MATLVIDTGQDIVGVFSVEARNYVPYRGGDILTAIRRIEVVDEIVTYNGKNYDLRELQKFARRPLELSANWVHSDMRSICWSDRILGRSLSCTYAMHFSNCPLFSDSYEGSNERDVYMTFKLWDMWKQRGLKILDGQEVRLR